MRRTSLAIAAIALALSVGLSATVPDRAQAASAYEQVLHVYEREGSIPPCQFTDGQLQSALGGVDTYGAQYFADFTQAVQAAMTSRAGGACATTTGSGSVAAGPSSGASGSGSPAPPPPQGSLTAATGAGVPLPLALLGGLAVVGALLRAGAGVTRSVRARGRR